MATAETTRRLTPEEYLARERKAEFKSEYFDGEIFAMAGASRQHNRITVNLTRELSSRLLEGPCEVYAGDMRVEVGPAKMYAYPDVVAVCGEPRWRDAEFDTLLNPVLVVEVLSPSTAAHDRGGKFERYQKLDSLAEFVLVTQDRIGVDRYTRRGDVWTLTTLTGADDVLRLESVGCEVPLRLIYARTGLAGD